MPTPPSSAEEFFLTVESVPSKNTPLQLFNPNVLCSHGDVMMCLVTQAFTILNVKGGGSPARACGTLVASLVEVSAGACISSGDAAALLVVYDC
jgi:hypothetical protein